MLRIILAVVFLLLVWAVVLVFSLPPWIAVVVTLAVVLIGAAWFAFAKYQAKKAATAIESTLKSQADAHAASLESDQQAEIQAMEAEFHKAIGALKTSKLARGGNDALGVLPWYLIIGPPGAGKSTALRNSGLQFPYLSSKGGGVRGVGGTRNCDWWLTNEAVVLDTAGRYTTEDQDRDEWSAFLDTLARARPRKPINGLLVAVSVGDLGGESEEGVVDLAKRIRERMDEVMSRLQVILPAYVLFTKCDLVPGFVETFGDLRKQERGQTWGFTFSVAERPESPGDAFAEKFDELAEVVEGRAMARLSEERNLGTRELIYQFPQQLGALRANLTTFVDQLFAENVYQDTPLMRGVYFTSGTQEGRTIDRVMGAMASAFGVRPHLAAGAPPTEAKSYFLRDVFKRVVFPDQNLAVRSAKAVRRDQLQRYGIAAAAVLAAIALFVFPLRAYSLNRSLVRSTAELVDVTAASLRNADGDPRLDALDPLRDRLELLRQFEAEGAPWAMRLGMYQGSSLLPGVRDLYGRAVRRLLVQPVFVLEQQELEDWSRRYAASATAMPTKAEYAAYYDRLKLHLVLSAPRAQDEPVPTVANQEWATERLVERWTGAAPTAENAAAHSVASHARLYLELLAADGALALPRHDGMVRTARVVLDRMPYTQLAMEKLVREVSPKGYDLTLPILLGELVPALSARDSAGDAKVRGAFTKKGYDLLKPKLDDPSSILEPWVLARAESEDQKARLEEAAAMLRTQYFEAFIGEWRTFLDLIKVDIVAGGGALGTAQELTRGEPPALERLINGVAENTQIAAAAAVAETVGGGMLDKLKKNLGAKGQVVTAAMGAAPVNREVTALDVQQSFKGLVAFATPVAPPGGSGNKKPSSLDLYQEQLTFVRDALRATRDGEQAGMLVERVSNARTRVRALVDSAEAGWRPRLQAILWPPIEAASRDSAAEAAAGAAQAWCATVAQPFKRSLVGRYPFARSGEDAAIADVSEFFRPGGVIWGFYDSSLATDIERAGDGFKFARQLGGVSGFRPEVLSFLKRAQDVTTVLFPAGAGDPKVDFTVRIRPTPGVAVVWFEVDGQKFDYRNGPEEWHKLSWPVMGKTLGASLRVKNAAGREEVIQQDGEWGLFRLIEAGALKGEPGVRDFAVAWNLPSLGTSVTVDFRPARTDSPFFGVRRGKTKAQMLAPFRAGVTPPSNIGKGGEACY